MKFLSVKSFDGSFIAVSRLALLLLYRKSLKQIDLPIEEIRVNFIVFISLLLMCELASAKFSLKPITDVLIELGFLSDERIEICNENPKRINKDIKFLARQAETLYTERSYCEAAEYYYNLSIDVGTGAEFHNAWKMRVQSYYNSGDYVLTMNVGNEYLSEYPNSTTGEEIQLIMLRALYEQSKISKDTKWISIGIGASALNSQENLFIKNLEYQAFLDKYPNNPYKLEIEANQAEGQNRYARFLLSEGRMQKVRMNYPESIRVLSLVTKWGPKVSIFEEALSELVITYVQFSWSLTNGRIPKWVLAKWLMKDTKEISDEMIARLASDTYGAGAKLLESFRKARPDSKWLSSAEAYFE